MANRTATSVLTLAALLACAIPTKATATWVTAVVANAPLSFPVAQAAPSFSVPNTVPAETKVRISSGSDNMNAISEALRQGFEGQYADSQIVVTPKSAEAALQDVLNDNADLAAISRPLTEEEKAKGLIAIPVRREKIAVVVGKDNPFSTSLTGNQFARIFRGEIRNWADLGGPEVKIRLVDRPAISETRQALRDYPVFKTAAFATGDNATVLEDNTTKALAESLGADGIGYVLVGQLDDQPTIRALPLHKTLPSDRRYPFSQPYTFVYVGGASPAASAFLGYATGRPGQAVVNDAGITGIGLIPDAGNGSAASRQNAASSNTNTSAAGGENATNDGADSTNRSEAAADGATQDTAQASSNQAAEGQATGEGAEGGNTSTSSDTSETTNGNAGNESNTGSETDRAPAEDTASGLALFGGNTQGRWWWLLLPLAGLALLIWAAGKRSSEEETGYNAISTDNEDDSIHRSFDTPLPATPSPVTETSTSADNRASLGITDVQPESDDLEASRSRIQAETGEVESQGVGLSAVAAGGAAMAGLGLASQAHARASDDIAEQLDSSETSNRSLSAENGLSDSSIVDTHQAEARTPYPTSSLSSSGPDSWLERAKQRINEAADQIQETTSDLDNLDNRDTHD